MISRRDFLLTGAVPFTRFRNPPRRILLLMEGGASHLDTFDLKPEAPSHIRGPFKPIRTNVPGIEISETFPLLARHADKFSLVRSVFHPGGRDHETGLGYLPRADAETLVVNVGRDSRSGQDAAWDAHGWGAFPSLHACASGVARSFDILCSSMLQQLHDQDLLKSTVVLATGEFGRSPYLNPQGGRDHWPHCWTVLVAGGGWEGGRIIGSSDATGAEPRDNPVSIEQLTRQLGFAPRTKPGDGKAI